MTEAAPPAGARPAKSDIRILSPGEVRTLTELGDVEVRGGFGAGLSRDPRSPGAFWLLSGRGPVFDSGKPFETGFALPSFSPSIARAEVRGDFFVHGPEIEMKATTGRRLSGLPTPPVEGDRAETPVTWDGRPLPLDRDGVHPRGLVAMSDGTFWMADAYGPHLLHLDATGTTLMRAGPFDHTRRLPRVLGRRAAGRGFSGLTVTPDEATLFAIMQSPLENPSSRVASGSRITRIVAFDIGSGSCRQFLYAQEDVDLSNGAILALGGSSFLVVERDDAFPGDPRRPAWIKRIYRIDLEDATEVSDPLDRDEGLLVDGRTMEELDPDALHAAGIGIATKRLEVDLLALGYPHDRPSGLAFFDDHTLALLNDDDFAVASSGRQGAGRLVPRILPQTGRISESELWLIPLPGLAGPRRN